VHELREMNIEDYQSLIGLWSRTEGLALSDADSEAAIDYYLKRNKGLSYVCTHEGRIVGTILCGHDGRRGYIYHVVVEPEFRGKSLGQELVNQSLKRLKEEGINKCHIMVIADNKIGNHFWNKTGWIRRDGILLYSHNT